MNQSKVSAVKQAAVGRWHEIFKAVTSRLDDAVERCPNHVPCPVGTGTTDGFRLFEDSNETGMGVSNSAGVFTSGFDLLMWVLDKDFTYVLNIVSGYLGVSGHEWKEIAKNSKPISTIPAKADPATLKKCRYKLRKAWMNSVDLTAPSAKIARKYLHKNRGLDLTKLDLHGLSKTMRYNPALELYEKGKYVGKFPAIVALVSYSDGKAATIHRTYLDAQGNKLAIVVDGNPVKAKKLMSRCVDRRLTGGAIHMQYPVGKILHVAEGIETTLSVKQVLATRNCADEAVWSTVSSALLAKLEPPKQVEHIFVWADKDRILYRNGKKIEAGLDAAIELANRMEDRGVWVHIMYPQSDIPKCNKSVDWNDELVTKGISAFPLHHRQIWGEAC